MDIDRRDFLKIAGIGTAVFVSGLVGVDGNAGAAEGNDFFFLQLSDTHWGFNNPKMNADYQGTLKKVVASVNSLKARPDFIMFTGDLTHTTDDDNERRTRLSGFRDIVRGLTVKDVRFMPGEHDAALDEGAAYKEFFGETHHAFDHKGVHFIVVDNVSDPRSIIGDSQLQWLDADLKKHDKESPIMVFTHRPLFNLYPDWDWYTRDGTRAVDLLTPYSNVTVFYGHIHQEHHDKTGNIAHHAAKGLMYPFPPPGSVPVKNPIPWDEAHPYRGLGFRAIDTRAKEGQLSITEFTVEGEKV
jgi:hypothetical protein